MHFLGLDEGLPLGGHRKVNSCVPHYINDNSRRDKATRLRTRRSPYLPSPSHLFPLVGKWAFHVVEMQYSVPCQLQSYHCPYLFPGNDILQDPNVVREPPLSKSTKLPYPRPHLGSIYSSTPTTSPLGPPSFLSVDVIDGLTLIYPCGPLEWGISA